MVVGCRERGQRFLLLSLSRKEVGGFAGLGLGRITPKLLHLILHCTNTFKSTRITYCAGHLPARATGLLITFRGAVGQPALPHQ